MVEKAHYLIIHFDQAVMYAPTDGNVKSVCWSIYDLWTRQNYLKNYEMDWH